MDRPTCKTCPYWDESSRDSDEGECRAHPPAEGRARATNEFLAIWRLTDRDEWCGEHPDFPAYLDSRKPSPVRGKYPQLTDDDPVYLLSLPYRAIRILAHLKVRTIGELKRTPFGNFHCSFGAGPFTIAETVLAAELHGIHLWRTESEVDDALRRYAKKMR